MRILIIDDEKNIRHTLQGILEDENYEVVTAASGEEGLELLQQDPCDLLFLDVKLPGIDGLEVLKRVNQQFTTTAVIMISGHSDIRTAVQAVRAGAVDFLEKPLTLSRISISAQNIAERIRLDRRNHQQVEDQQNRYRMIGESASFEELQTTLTRVSQTDTKVLIRGESGTGKELVAFAIHHRSPRHDQPFIRFNSAAIPNELVESELFGFEKGAFTGAGARKTGKIEAAQGGTLFLDEIGDMNLTAQAKVLRVLQEGVFERVGGTKPIEVDVRVLAATNKNLEQMIASGEFREDLFYRLNVFPMVVPPLRERPEDIDALIRWYNGYFSREMQSTPLEFSPEACELVKQHPFPGNVRELRNLVERLFILAADSKVSSSMLASQLTGGIKPAIPNSLQSTMSYTEARRRFEVYYLELQLDKFDGNISRVARELGLQQPNLSRKLKELGIRSG
jgi:two-component system, NtrC family, nitrogen regulation response regulator NtrX